MRRRGLVLGGALLPLAALAQAPWPQRPIRIVIPYPPGGASDIIARMLAPHLTESLGQTVVVENRPGANGFIAGELVARAAPDGYTLLMANAGPNGMGPALYGSRTPYDARRDFAPVMAVSVVPQIMAVHPDVPVRNVPEFLGYVKEMQGRMSYGSAGIGSAGHMAMELLKSLTGVELTHVPYRGSSPSTADLIAGVIPVNFDTVPVLLPHHRAGRVRGIAVSSRDRVPEAPELAAIAETVPGFETVSWGGILAPAATPKSVVERLNAALRAAMTRPDVAGPLAAQGVQPQSGSPEAFGAYVESELQKWTEVVQRMGLRPE
ncbi:tripartite tricarboxylate transporter substrate binding protein [Siccirubricoccus sp. KC 17139]|uniref:Tripartite tricarboxylate transporter substrate binding protein n=1 Tax=Siccirubricoccus soli TaxID=2899147 RepID=A0ABT1DAC6_9PROT|nr:tripartite tricarboxylate transporter substrate binding protein [Siccirubricoccus soli]MCO6418883.1 tripartite tricarboxylate transporter substrate binding protein [Siccirubricoccus soli]MCP2685018.1 tripartite tricarboxylate transporter substrate binding protein [Siccirubricoccus soli]